MRALDLRDKLNPALHLPFDYASLGDPDVEKKLKAAADKINAIHDAAMIDIGRVLLAVKDSLKHGSFLDWVQAEFSFGRRTAVRMMQVAAEFGAKWDTVSHLPPTVLYKLAAPSTPSAVREAVLKLKPGEVVTPQGVQTAINAVKRAEKRSEIAAPMAASTRHKEQKAPKPNVQEEWLQEAQDKRSRDSAVACMKLLLGGLLPEISNIFEQVGSIVFSNIVTEMVLSYRVGNRTGESS